MLLKRLIRKQEINLYTQRDSERAERKDRKNRREIISVRNRAEIFPLLFLGIGRASFIYSSVKITCSAAAINPHPERCEVADAAARDSADACEPGDRDKVLYGREEG